MKISIHKKKFIKFVAIIKNHVFFVIILCFCLVFISLFIYHRIWKISQIVYRRIFWFYVVSSTFKGNCETYRFFCCFLLCLFYSNFFLRMSLWILLCFCLELKRIFYYSNCLLFRQSIFIQSKDILHLFMPLLLSFFFP